MREYFRNHRDADALRFAEELLQRLGSTATWRLMISVFVGRLK